MQSFISVIADLILAIAFITCSVSALQGQTFKRPKCGEIGRDRELVPEVLDCMGERTDKNFEEIETESRNILKQKILRCFPRDKSDCGFTNEMLMNNEGSWDPLHFNYLPHKNGQCESCFIPQAVIKTNYLTHENRTCWNEVFLKKVREFSQSCTNGKVYRTLDVDFSASFLPKRVNDMLEFIRLSMLYQNRLDNCHRTGNEQQYIGIARCMEERVKNKRMCSNRKQCIVGTKCAGTAKKHVDLVCECFLAKKRSMAAGLKDLGLAVVRNIKKYGAKFNFNEHCISYIDKKLKETNKGSTKIIDWLDLFEKANAQCNTSGPLNVKQTIIVDPCKKIPKEMAKGDFNASTLQASLDVSANLAGAVMDRFGKFCACIPSPSG